MGGGEPEGESPCTGDDVLNELNDPVFGDPTSDQFKQAKEHEDEFKDIKKDDQGNYQALINAYENAGVDVCPNWQNYLAQLGPENIYRIAQARYDGLKRNAPMSTTTHKPEPGGGHVHTKGVGVGPITIDSPYDPTTFYRKSKPKS